MFPSRGGDNSNKRGEGVRVVEKIPAKYSKEKGIFERTKAEQSEVMFESK